MPTRRLRRIRWKIGLALCACLLSGHGPASAAAVGTTAPQSIATQPPPGFENLTRPQNMLIDLFYGGRRIGAAMALYEPGRLTFRDPGTVAGLLPRIKDRARVLQALSGPLPTHPELVCTQHAKSGCGMLRPEIAGLIFDDGRFRADLFVNPELLETAGPNAEKYLPAPTAGLSLANTLGGAVAGSSRESNDYDFQNRAVFGYREGRLRTDFGYSSNAGFLTDSAALEVDEPAVRYTGGLFWARGLDFIGQRQIYGVGVGTQTDTRADHDQAIGNALVVFLPQRSQVEILRDGRLMSSRFYDAGNQILDTSDLPEGSYNVVLRIRETGDGVREERRFFVKNSNMPLLDEPVYFAYAGALSADTAAALPGVGSPFAQAGIARRLSDSLAVDLTSIGTDEILLAEAGTTWFSDLAQIRVAGLGSLEGDLGILVNASSTDLGNFSYGIDARQIWGKGHAEDSHNNGNSQQVSFSPVNLSNPRLLDGNGTQVSGSLGYQWGGVQVGLLGSYQNAADTESTYSLGPTVYWPFWRNRDMTMTLVGQAAQSNDSFQIYAGLRLQFDRPRFSAVSEAGVQSTRPNESSDGRDTGAVGRVFGKFTQPDVLDSDLSVGAGVGRTVNTDTGRIEGDLRGAYGNYFANAEHDFDGSQAATRYGANFVTGIAATPGSATIGGESDSESAILVRLEGTGDGRFEVLVDGAPRGRLSVGHQLAIFLTPYRKYSVRITPVDAPLVEFDTSERETDLYPGNVQTLSWKVDPIVAVFGRALTPDGRPIANARIEGAHEVGQTDGNGFFQVEVSPEASLTLVAGNASPCRVKIANLQPKNGYAPLGAVTCR